MPEAHPICGVWLPHRLNSKGHCDAPARWTYKGKSPQGIPWTAHRCEKHRGVDYSAVDLLAGARERAFSVDHVRRTEL